MDPKTYLKTVRKKSIKDAAKELGVSRVWLTYIVNAREQCSISLAKKFEEYSCGEVSKIEMINLYDNAQNSSGE